MVVVESGKMLLELEGGVKILERNKGWAGGYVGGFCAGPNAAEGPRRGFGIFSHGRRGTGRAPARGFGADLDFREGRWRGKTW